MVPVELPKAQVSVWVKEEEALEIVIVVALPIFTEVAVTEDALGMVFSVCVPLADTLTAQLQTPASQLNLKDFAKKRRGIKIEENINRNGIDKGVYRIFGYAVL